MYQLGFDLQAVPSLFCSKRFATRDALGRQNDPLLLLRQIAGETPDARGTEPNAAVCDLDVGKYVRHGEFLLLALRGLCFVGCKGCNVDQGSDPVIRPCVRNQRAAVGVANEDHRAIDLPEAANDALDIALQRV